MAQFNRDNIPMTDEQIEARFDALGFGLTAGELSYVTDTIPDFLSGRDSWAERGSVVEQTADTLHIERVQPRRGAQRRDVVVIDLGPCRAVYGADR